MHFDEIKTIYIKQLPKFTTHCSYFCLLSQNSSKVFFSINYLEQRCIPFSDLDPKRKSKVQCKKKTPKTQYTFGNRACFQSRDFCSQPLHAVLIFKNIKYWRGLAMQNTQRYTFFVEIQNNSCEIFITVHRFCNRQYRTKRLVNYFYKHIHIV